MMEDTTFVELGLCMRHLVDDKTPVSADNENDRADLFHLLALGKAGRRVELSTEEQTN